MKVLLLSFLLSFCYLAGEIDTRFSFCAVATLALLVRGQNKHVKLNSGAYIHQRHTTNRCIGKYKRRMIFCPIKGKLDAINVDKAVEFVLSCMNFDGGFGCRPGSESHAGQVLTLLVFTPNTYLADGLTVSGLCRF